MLKLNDLIQSLSKNNIQHQVTDGAVLFDTQVNTQVFITDAATELTILDCVKKCLNAFPNHPGLIHVHKVIERGKGYVLQTYTYDPTLQLAKKDLLTLNGHPIRMSEKRLAQSKPNGVINQVFTLLGLTTTAPAAGNLAAGAKHAERQAVKDLANNLDQYGRKVLWRYVGLFSEKLGPTRGSKKMVAYLRSLEKKSDANFPNQEQIIKKLKEIVADRGQPLVGARHLQTKNLYAAIEAESCTMLSLNKFLSDRLTADRSVDKAAIRKFADEFEKFRYKLLWTKSGIMTTKGAREIAKYIEKVIQLPDPSLPTSEEFMAKIKEIVRNRTHEWSSNRRTLTPSPSRDKRRTPSTRKFYDEVIKDNMTLQYLTQYMTDALQNKAERVKELQAERGLEWVRRNKFYYINNALGGFLAHTPYGNLPTGIKEMRKLLDKSRDLTEAEMFEKLQEIANARLAKDVGSRRDSKTRDFYEYVVNNASSLDNIIKELADNYVNEHGIKLLKDQYPELFPEAPNLNQ